MRNVLGIVLPMGQSRKLLEETGQWSLWEKELAEYRKVFVSVELFEYRHRDFRRFVETLVFPIVERKRLKRCFVLKAVHLTGAIPCLMAKLLSGIPYVLSYGYRYDEFAAVEGKWGGWLLSRLLTPIAIKFANAVMVPTRALEEYVSGLRVRRVWIIPNGVDIKSFAPNSKLKTQNSKLVVLFVGRLERQKNLVNLIYALSEIELFRKKTRDRVSKTAVAGKLVIIGDGGLKQELGDLAIRLKVNADFQGVVANDKLAAVYRNADIFVLPSLIEGHPKALIEAMGCGLACIASDIAGVREIIESEVNGLLVQPTVIGLTEGLKRLTGDISLRRRLGAEARKTIINRFDKSKLMRKEILFLQRLAFFEG